MTIHKPVLLKEAIELLNLKPGMIVVDATLGGGGHSCKILEGILPDGKLIAFDQDEESIIKFKKYLNKSSQKKENVILVNDNFSRLKINLKDSNINKVGAVLADLGISSDQLENSGRGFSFLRDEPLDMRLSKKGRLTAAQVINSYPEKSLIKILREYGGEKLAVPIAKKIVLIRKNKPIITTHQLVKIIKQSVPEKYKHQKIHFATKTFQAIRMEVNNEIDNLKSFLSQAVEMLDNGGRIVIISFHSGEDKIVKNFFRENVRGNILTPEGIIYGQRTKPILKIITPRPIVAEKEEVQNNPRARSAKLRVAEKI